MLESLRALTRPLMLIAPNYAQQSVRTTFILQRRYPPRLPKMIATKPRKLKKKDFTFDLIKYESAAPKEPINVILLKYVEGIGGEGDIVSVHPTVAYQELLLPKLACYVNEENLKKFAFRKDEQTYSSKYVGECLRSLSTQLVHVLMSNKNSWTIEPWHIRVALRREGIIVSEDAIELKAQIQGPDPNLESKEFPIKITINGKETVWVRCRINHWDRMDNSSNFKQIYYSDIDNDKVCEPVSEEFREILKSMPKPILKERCFIPDAPWTL